MNNEDEREDYTFFAIHTERKKREQPFVTVFVSQPAIIQSPSGLGFNPSLINKRGRSCKTNRNPFSWSSLSPIIPSSSPLYVKMPKTPPQTKGKRKRLASADLSLCKNWDKTSKPRLRLYGRTIQPLLADAGFCARVRREMQMQCNKNARSLADHITPSALLRFFYRSFGQSPGSDCTRDWYLLRKDDPSLPPSSPPACTSVQPSNTGRSLCTVTASATSSASSLRLARGVERRRR